MKILVTGGTGFTGKALVLRLLREGHEVTALDYQEGLRNEEIRSAGGRVVIGSVTDPKVVEASIEGAEIVHHLAAAFRELNVPNSHYEKVNIEGTRTVLDAAVKTGASRFIYCSTCGVHGNVDNPPGDENAPIHPADYYQRTKYEAEPLVLRYHSEGRIPGVILRPAAIYGPGDPERFGMIFKRVARGRFPMFGSGKTLYHPLYIDNLVDAFLLAMEAGRGDGNAYLIADREYLSIEELVRKTARALGVEVKIPHYPVWPLVAAGHICEKLCQPFGLTPPIFPRRVDWYRQNRAFDITKAVRELGYDPAVGIDEGLRRTAAWYRENGYL